MKSIEKQETLAEIYSNKAYIRCKLKKVINYKTPLSTSFLH